jgi:hypothetical protein
MVFISTRSARLLTAWWLRNRSRVLWTAIAILGLLALVRCGIELWRLVGVSHWVGAVDLNLRHRDIRHWFGGLPVYTDRTHSGYLPASFVLLWPLLGWLPSWPARWLWAIVNLAVLAFSFRFALRHSGAEDGRDRAFFVLMLLAPYAVPGTLGNGQLGTLLLPALVAALWLLEPTHIHLAVSWRKDLLAAALLVFALMKPSLTVPFFWIVLLRPRRLRPTVLVGLGYAAVSILAQALRSRPLLTDLADVLRISEGVVVADGLGHVPRWMAQMGLGGWHLWGSAVVLAALGVWVARNRDADLWRLLGVTGIAARIWMYHRPYDDSLILLAMIALFRIAKQDRRKDGADVVAGLLLAVALLVEVAPGSFVYREYPWNIAQALWQPLVWGVMTIFLCSRSLAPLAAATPPTGPARGQLDGTCKDRCPAVPCVR